jgi:hypothetical protein
LIDATRNLSRRGALLFDSRRDRTGDSVNLSDFLSDLSYRCGRRKQRRPRTGSDQFQHASPLPVEQEGDSAAAPRNRLPTKLSRGSAAGAAAD